jgi:hypothetical protein
LLSILIFFSTGPRPWCLRAPRPVREVGRESRPRARNRGAFWLRPALGDQRLHLGVGQEALRGRGFEHVEDGVEAGQEGQRRRGVTGAEFARVHGDVGLPDELEDRPQGLGRVQVVVHGGGELRLGLGGARGQLFIEARGELLGLEAQPEVAQPLDGHGGGFQAVEGEIERLAIGDRGQQVADGLGGVAARHHVPQGVEVAQRLGHLLPFHQQEFRVQPETGERLAGERFRLRDLVLMVRKDEVHAARVQVERIAQVLDGHHGALDVPAGAAGADLGVPEGLALLGGLPQGEIARVVFFVLVGIHARAADDAAEIGVGQLAVLREAGDTEVDRPVAGIGMAAFPELADGLHHLVDVFGGAHQFFGALQPQGGAVVQEGLGVGLGVFVDGPCWATAFWMMRSSTSVTFMTWERPKPEARSQRRSTSMKTKVRKLPMWAKS